MPVRNSAKAIVIHEGKLLVNKCVSRFGEYFALPGGGQRCGEMLNETVRRELLEETGYSVIPLRLSGIYDKAKKQMYDGPGNVMRRVEGLKALGVTPKKQLKALEDVE